LERETPLTLLKVGSHMAVEEPFTTRGWEYYGHMAVEEKREKKNDNHMRVGGESHMAVEMITPGKGRNN